MKMKVLAWKCWIKYTVQNQHRSQSEQQIFNVRFNETTHNVLKIDHRKRPCRCLPAGSTLSAESQPAGWGTVGACGIVPSETWRVKTVTASVVRNGSGAHPVQAASEPVHTWHVGPWAGSQAVQAGPSQLQPESQPALCRGSPTKATRWGRKPVLGHRPGLRPREGPQRGRVRRVPAGTPENRAQPPRKGSPCEGQQGRWGTEASSGQTVLCEMRNGGPQAARPRPGSGSERRACDPRAGWGPRPRFWARCLALLTAPAFSVLRWKQPRLPVLLQAQHAAGRACERSVVIREPI